MRRAVTLERLALLAGLTAQSTCGAGFSREVSARPAAATTIVHDEGHMKCSDSFDGPKIDWSASSDATTMRRQVVEALVRDTVDDPRLARVKWCVLTDTTGWKVPPGVRTMPHVDADELRLRDDCRLFEIDPSMPIWQSCTYDGRPVRVIAFQVRWLPRASEKRSLGSEERGVDDDATYDVFRDGGRVVVARQHSVER